MATTAIDVDAPAVAEAIQAYIEAVEAKDLDAYARIVAHDPDLTWYGSMPGQIVGWGEVESVISGMFDELSGIRITQTDLRVHFSPDRNLAWATCLWDFRAKVGDQDIVEPTRCTWVLERRDARWVILHWHKSVGVPG
jgi:ketosteroid isomerase-like protein